MLSPPPAPPSRILIIKPSSLGDVVHALPVLTALRQAHPTAHIAWLVSHSFAPLLEGHPLLDEVIRFERRRFGTMWWNPVAHFEFWRFVAALRRRRFDLVLDLQGLIRSGLLSYFCGAPRRIGFADAREGAWLFYTERVTVPGDCRHAVDRNIALAAAAGIRIAQPAFPLGLTEAEMLAARQRFRDAAGGELDAFCALLPGARWESKRWPAAAFADLIDQMDLDSLPRAVLLGAPDEQALAADIARRCDAPVVNLVGQTTLRELAAVLSLATVVVSNDSGPMHLAAALGRPLVSLFGPTDPRRTGPYGATAQVLTHAVPCAPCLRRRCPLVHHDCLERLPVERVLASVRAALAATPQPR